MQHGGQVSGGAPGVEGAVSVLGPLSAGRLGPLSSGLCSLLAAPHWPLLRLFHFRTLLVSRCFQKEAQTPDRGLTLGTGWGPSLPWPQKTLTSSRIGQHARSRLHLQPLFLCRD